MMFAGGPRLQERGTALVFPGFAILAVLFYAIPLFSSQVSIHWDLADVSYPVQKYFADSVRAGRLPHWTPYLFSGMPFLSDPAVGAWYPLHWPLFLIGITPRAMVWELALHAFIALTGAYLLALRCLRTGVSSPGANSMGDAVPAALAAVLYAFNGFFAAHATDLGLFEAASLLPWLLWAALSAAETGAIDSYALTALVAGLIVLTGHFGAAAFCGLALFVLLAAAVLTREIEWTRVVGALAAAGVGAFLISAVVLLPWFEINHLTTRYDVDPAAGAALQPKALGTVMAADYFGLMSGTYKGPEGLRLNYFYGGLLAIPLALAGFARKRMRIAMAALIVLTLWYSFGPIAGFARALDKLPAFRDAGSPAAIWFVVALGVALAASSGAVWVGGRVRRERLPYALLVLTIADLWFWNQYKNPLTFAHTSYADLYGKRQDSFEAHIKVVKDGVDASAAHNGQAPEHFYRIWAPEPIGAFGPLDGALNTHTESTWGAGLLELNRHAEYMRAIPSNPSLLNGLSITDLIDVGRGMLAGNPAALPRVTAPRQVTFVRSPAEARAALLKLNQDDAAVVEAAPRSLAAGAVELRTTGYEESAYRLHYRAQAEGMLRVSVPYAPGWRAAVDGRSLEVYPADYALCGVFVPAGEHDLEFRFRPETFRLGAGLSLAGGLLALAALAFGAPKQRSS